MEITLSATIEMFVATKATEGRSERTTKWYQDMLMRFCNFAGQPKLKDVTVDTARAFVASLQAQEVKFTNHPWNQPVHEKLSVFTIHGYVRALKAFSAWLHEEGFTSHDIFERLKRPKKPETLIETLTDKEIGELLAAINPSSFLGARQYLIVLLLLDTGIRANELCTLTVENTHLDDGVIKVHGKGNKERIVPFGSGTKKALIRYLTTFRPETEAEELILSANGSPLTVNGLELALRRLGKNSGVTVCIPTCAGTRLPSNT